MTKKLRKILGFFFYVVGTKQNRSIMFTHIINKTTYNILKNGGIIMKILKKTLGVCLIGLGIGILLVLFLPTLGWLFLIGIVVILVGILWLLC